MIFVLKTEKDFIKILFRGISDSASGELNIVGVGVKVEVGVGVEVNREGE